MKTLLSLLLVASLLSGCAVYPAAPAAGVYVAPPAVVITPGFYYHRHGYWR
ncbi:MAG: hypothetical protein JSR49_04660 [Proteobacteria bacterium]|nr:hypothetical protein [Pseudomonadota bacterium]